MEVITIDKLKGKAFWLGILGAVKLATDAFGYNIITNEQVDGIANGIALILTVVSGIWVSHDKK